MLYGLLRLERAALVRALAFANLWLMRKFFSLFLNHGSFSVVRLGLHVAYVEKQHSSPESKFVHLVLLQCMLARTMLSE